MQVQAQVVISDDFDLVEVRCAEADPLAVEDMVKLLRGESENLRDDRVHRHKIA